MKKEYGFFHDVKEGFSELWGYREIWIPIVIAFIICSLKMLVFIPDYKSPSGIAFGFAWAVCSYGFYGGWQKLKAHKADEAEDARKEEVIDKIISGEFYKDIK